MVVLQTDSNRGTMAERYTFLKTEVIKQILTSPTTPTNYPDILIRRYQPFINSPRTASILRQTRRINDLIAVLEQRDCVSASDVTILAEIACLLKCTEAISAINDYKKRCNLIGSTRCDVCGKDDTELVPKPPPPPAPPQPSRKPEPEEKPSSQGLDEAIERISRRLGRSWKNLARTKEMGFKEYDIDMFETDYKYMADQISHMFQEWRERHGKRATLPKLIKALINARRRDLADLLTDDDDDY